MKHGCPQWQQSQTMAKISKSYILTLPPGACDVSEVWATLRWTYSQSLVTVWPPQTLNNALCLHTYISGAELRTDGQTDDPNTRCPQLTFQAGGIKITVIIATFYFALDDLCKYYNNKTLVKIKGLKCKHIHFCMLTLLLLSYWKPRKLFSKERGMLWIMHES